MTRTKERLLALQARMREMRVDLAALGPTANMRYLLGFTPHPDERLCLLLVGTDAVRMVVPGVNREQVAANTDVELVAWADADGPREALRQALSGWQLPRSLAVDGVMRADFLLQLQTVISPVETVPVDNVLSPLRQ